MQTLLFSYRLSDLWTSLGTLSRACCLALLLTSIYSLFSATKAMARLRALRRLNPVQELASIQLTLAGVRELMANVRQANNATFYLFGIVFFSNLETINPFFEHFKTPVDNYTFLNFLLQFSLAKCALVVFLALHLIQWFVVSRVNSCSRRLKTRLP